MLGYIESSRHSSTAAIASNSGNPIGPHDIDNLTTSRENGHYGFHRKLLLQSGSTLENITSHWYLT